MHDLSVKCISSVEYKSLGNIVQVLEYYKKRQPVVSLVPLLLSVEFSKSYQHLCKRNTVQLQQLLEKLGNMYSGKSKAVLSLYSISNCGRGKI